MADTFYCYLFDFGRNLRLSRMHEQEEGIEKWKFQQGWEQFK